MEAVEALLATASAKPRGRQPVLIDTFLAAVRSLSDATPSDKDLEVTKQFLRLLNDQTAVDHLKSVDEMIAQVPTEFAAAQRDLRESETFIYHAASGQVELVRRALDRNWELLHSIDRDGHTALHAAAAEGNLEVAELLLSRGANPSSQDYEGATCLHWAVEANSQSVATALLAAGVDVSVKNNSGQTAGDLVSLLKPKQQEAWLTILAPPASAPEAPTAGGGGARAGGSPRAASAAGSGFQFASGSPGRKATPAVPAGGR